MAKLDDTLDGFEDFPPELQPLILSPSGLGGPDALLRALPTSKLIHDRIKRLDQYWRKEIRLLLLSYDIIVTSASLKK